MLPLGCTKSTRVRTHRVQRAAGATPAVHLLRHSVQHHIHRHSDFTTHSYLQAPTRTPPTNTHTERCPDWSTTAGLLTVPTRACITGRNRSEQFTRTYIWPPGGGLAPPAYLHTTYVKLWAVVMADGLPCTPSSLPCLYICAKNICTKSAGACVCVCSLLACRLVSQGQHTPVAHQALLRPAHCQYSTHAHMYCLVALVGNTLERKKKHEWAVLHGDAAETLAKAHKNWHCCRRRYGIAGVVKNTKTSNNRGCQRHERWEKTCTRSARCAGDASARALRQTTCPEKLPAPHTYKYTVHVCRCAPTTPGLWPCLW